jgi:hypothetical protein
MTEIHDRRRPCPVGGVCGQLTLVNDRDLKAHSVSYFGVTTSDWFSPLPECRVSWLSVRTVGTSPHPVPSQRHRPVTLIICEHSH